MIASSTRDELSRFLQQCRTQRVRSIREFAEQEIVIPDGPYAGRRFRCDRQPYTALWLDSIGSQRWTGHVATAASRYPDEDNAEPQVQWPVRCLPVPQKRALKTLEN